MKDILLIEDDKALSKGICLALQNENIKLWQSYNLASAKIALSKKPFDLVILDLNLPDGNGLHYLSEIKKIYLFPVVLLTANDTEIDIVTGLEMGADDYITKPFSLAVLRARVNTQLRKQVQNAANSYEQDGFLFDFDRMEFFHHAKRIDLSKTEQKLLRLLLENRGITMERAVLIDRIWTDGAEYVDENALSVTVKRLRDKLDTTPSSPCYIKTVYGIGYTLPLSTK